MPLKIAIIGAGPSGCLIARLLQQSKQDITVTIFESESGPNFRAQGGTLDLHESTGLAALKAANLFPQFSAHARYDGEAMKICDKRLLCYINQEGSKPQSEMATGRPEIDRPKLRELLYQSLKPHTVVWSRKLQRVEEDGSLVFAGGEIERDFDLVVGADGAWSHVRPRVTDTKPFYSGIAGHAFTIPDARKNWPGLYALVNRGSLFAWSDGKSINAQQMGDGSIQVGTWSVRSEHWQQDCGYDVHSAEAVKAACEREFSGWDGRLLAFTQVGSESVVPRDLYMLPVGMRWEHVRGVTLVGDAAHLMTPFAGEGVNAAFTDSHELAKAIISAAGPSSSADASEKPSSDSDALDKAVRKFEEEMFVRAKEVQTLTNDMMTYQFFMPGSPRAVIEKYILRAIEGEFGYWITLFVATPLVYLYFWIFKMIW